MSLFHLLIVSIIFSHPVLAYLHCILQEFVRQELLYAPTLFGVIDEALLNEVSKGRAPFLWKALNRIYFRRKMMPRQEIERSSEKGK